MSDTPDHESPDDIEAAAIRLLAVREHSRAELLRKLLDRGLNAVALEPVLDDLVRRGLLSDERFAEQYVSMRVRRGYGPLRIRAELRERGVDSGLISTQLDSDGYDWRELIRDTRSRKFGVHHPADRKETARQARFLSQRGFPDHLIREALFDD